MRAEQRDDPAITQPADAIIRLAATCACGSCGTACHHGRVSALSAESESELRAAGWLPDRRVDPYAYLDGLDLSALVLHPAAERFLAEFGGLALTPNGPGVTRAKEHFTLDPRLCDGEEDRFADWSRSTGWSLFPIGELDYGRFFLGIDEHSGVYLVETWIASFGRMPLAMENLLSGVMPIEVA